MEENHSFRKEFQKVEAAAAASVKAELMARSEYINDILIVTGSIKASSVDMMKMVAQKARESGEILVLGIGAEIKGKANLVVMVSKELVDKRKISAAEIIKEISSEILGGGGGQSFLATAGGKNPQGIESALLKLKDFIKQNY
jgi:alanyl-tRNA synthetase